MSRDEAPKEWADWHFFLGNLLEELGKRSGEQSRTQYLEKAAAAYEASLEIITREQMPENWALIQSSLGDVLLKLADCSSRQEGVEYLKRSIIAYNNVLTIFTPEVNATVNKFVGQKLEKAKEALRKISRE